MSKFKLADDSVVTTTELSKLRMEDFKFKALCKAKHNYGMYRLLRDTRLDKVEEVSNDHLPS
jgi:hypothetical protein